MLIIALSAALASAQAPPAPAPAPSPSAANAGAPVAVETNPGGTDKAEPSNQIVCRIWVPTGTRLGGVHACKTRAEWDQLGFDTGREVTHAQMQAYDGAPGH